MTRNQPRHRVGADGATHGPLSLGLTHRPRDRAVADNTARGDGHERLPDLDLKVCAADLQSDSLSASAHVSEDALRHRTDTDRIEDRFGLGPVALEPAAHRFILQV